MKHKDKILELWSKGYSYRQIQAKLGCSKGTIAYHCGEGQKYKSFCRSKIKRDNQHPLVRKVETFRTKKFFTSNNKKTIPVRNKLKEKLYIRIHNFSLEKSGVYNMLFTVEDLLQKIGNNPKCSLSGRPIDLMDSKSYELDHIVSRSNGGDNSLENCQLLLKSVNRMKHNLDLEEFISLCKDIANNN